MSKIIVPPGGESAGELELMRTTFPVARGYADHELYENHRLSLREELPGFKDNYAKARRKTRNAHALRANMPVLDEGDLPEIKRLLVALDDKAEMFCDRLLCMPDQLIPVQEQIYFDKSMNGIAEHGITDTITWLRTRHVFTSKEGKILDGHHGWLSGMLIHPHEVQMLQFRIFKPLSEVLPFLKKFSQSQGRVPNA